MFKVNPDGMRMEPTPERVLAVCRLIAHSSLTREDVRKLMTLGNDDENELDQINKSISVALDELATFPLSLPHRLQGVNRRTREIRQATVGE